MIYILIPVYNEEANIAGLIEAIRKTLSGKDYLIIAVNDGSRDGSLSVLNNLKSDDLDIVSHKINMNVGAVFSDGINRAIELSSSDDDRLIIMEGDKTSSVDIIPGLIDEIETGSDVVIASRYKGEGCYKGFPFFRLVYSRAANALMRRLFPIENASDYTIFFRSYRLNLLKDAVIHFGPSGLIQSRGFTANAELLIKLGVLGARITEMPFVYDYSVKKGKSKLNVIKTITEYLMTVSYLREVKSKVTRYRERGMSI